MPKKYAKCTKSGQCWIKDCLYSKLPKSFVAPDGRRVEPRRQIQLFRFPPEPDRFASWVQAVGPRLLNKEPGRLCKHHFVESDFINGGEIERLVLKRSAVPSLIQDYPRRAPDPVKKKVESTNEKNENEPATESKRQSPTPTMKKVLGLADEECDEYDSDTDVDEIVESELGFKLKRKKKEYNMLSDDDVDGGDDSQSMIEGEEFEGQSSDEEVQIELIKLMAKKARGASPPPSPHFGDESPPPPDADACSQSSNCSAADDDNTAVMFHSLERIYRCLQPEIQLLTKENLLAVMKMAKKMDDDFRKNNRLVLKPRVFKCSGDER